VDDSDSVVALISALGGLIIAITPLVIRYMRATGVAIDVQTETLIRDAAREGVLLAEEYARRKPSSSSEKLMLATAHAQRLLEARGIKTTPSAMGLRVEAQIPAALPNRPAPSRLSFPERE
jgi:hypothetical protein